VRETNDQGQVKVTVYGCPVCHQTVRDYTAHDLKVCPFCRGELALRRVEWENEEEVGGGRREGGEVGSEKR
jgi:rRNA maturation endonuclease Nob1